jgi:hypothetical protein
MCSGVTFVAVGNAADDIFEMYAAFTSNKARLGFSLFFGVSIFFVTIVFGTLSFFTVTNGTFDGSQSICAVQFNTNTETPKELLNGSAFVIGCDVDFLTSVQFAVTPLLRARLVCGGSGDSGGSGGNGDSVDGDSVDSVERW